MKNILVILFSHFNSGYLCSCKVYNNFWHKLDIWYDIMVKEVGINIITQFTTLFFRSVDYRLIAFNERVTLWLQRVRSLPCTCAYVAFLARTLAYNHYVIAHAYNAANTHAQGSDPAR